MRVISVLCALLIGVVRAADGQTLVVSAPQSLAWAAARVQAVERQSLVLALARAGLDMPADVRVTLVPENDPQAAQWPRWILGFAVAPGDIVIFPQRATRYPYDSLESVVRHEVAHLALTGRAGGRPLPRWFHEGVAVSIEAGFGFSDQARLLGAMASRPAIGDVGRLFAVGTEPESAQAYLLAAALVADLRRRHGAEVVGVIADGVERGLSFDRAFALGTGETVEAATATAWGIYQQWASWILTLSSPSSVWTLVLVLALAAFVVQRRRRAHRRQQWDEEA